MSKKGHLVILSGPSGVGKGTVCKQLLADLDNLSFSVSATSRTPRGEDKEGVTYFFKTRKEFEQMIADGAFLEWMEYNGNYYGTPITAIQEKLDNGINVILEIDVVGALRIKKLYPDGIYIFLAPPGLDALRKRLADRGTESDAEISGRMEVAEKELQKKDEYDYVVINDDLDKAVQAVKNIIQERNDVL